MGKKKPVKTAEAPAPVVRTGKAINVWIDSGTFEALQEYIEAQRVPPTKTSVVEIALKEFLTSVGYPPKS